jgi:hypothetical protein
MMATKAKENVVETTNIVIENEVGVTTEAHATVETTLDELSEGLDDNSPSDLDYDPEQDFSFQDSLKDAVGDSGFTDELTENSVKDTIDEEYTPEVPTTKYVPVVDSVSSGNVIGFFTVKDVADFVSSARLMMNERKLAIGLDNEYGEVMGVFDLGVVIGVTVLVLEAKTTEQAQALNKNQDFDKLTSDDGYKFSAMLKDF